MKKSNMILLLMSVIGIFLIITLFVTPISSQSVYAIQSEDVGEAIIVDQENDPPTTTSYGCGVTGWTLFQSFTPELSSLVDVKLRLREGGNFPIEGVYTTINIREGSPNGTILTSATSFVEHQELGNQVLVSFQVDINLTPGNLYIVEWGSPAPPGVPPGAYLSWMGRDDDPYPNGNMFSCSQIPVLTNDLNFKTFVSVDVMNVQIDIKPGSDPSCFNNDGHGVIPVAILGTVDFDVSQIDAGSVQLEGIDVSAKGKSNKLLAGYEDVNGDGFTDLVLKIEDVDGTFTQGSGVATLTGNLLPEFGGTPIEGTSDICITQ